MAEPSEIQALSKISTEIDESQINVILSSQCIKAQSFLLDKLRKQADRHKEVCGFLSSANLKLECEIKQAELEIGSSRSALETVKHANVELKKEYLLAKEKKSDIAERISAGERKYEQLWLDSKTRYESISFVQNFLRAQSIAQTLQDDILNTQNQAGSLAKEVEIKRNEFKILDRNRVVELAHYLIHDMPKKLQVIQETNIKINELTKQLEEMENEMNAREELPPEDTIITKNEDAASKEKNNVDGNNWAGLNNEDTLMMLRFEESNIDLDIISDKLEKVKKVDLLNYTSTEYATIVPVSEKNNGQSTKYDWNVLNMEPYISPYFTKIDNKNVENEKRYSGKKLINILDDINVGKKDAYNILAKVNPKNLQEVSVINANIETSGAAKQNLNVHLNSEKNEEINISSCNDNIVVPPTQFLDLSQEKIFDSSQRQDENITKESENVNDQCFKSSQEAKQVSFNLSTSMEICEEAEKLDQSVANATNETITNPLDNSAVSDEDFQKIKDMVLKKHQLPSSPEFVYAKNTLHTNTTPTVTSKFFESGTKMDCGNAIVDGGHNKITGNDCSGNKTADENFKENVNKMNIEEIKETRNNEAMEIDNVEEINTTKCESQRANVSGLLFTHSGGNIPESLNTSMSTTGYEDGDGDFPQFIDSNLLLSPKADTHIGDENVDVKSQEVPNFLSGLRKTGLSLFGNLPSHTKVDSNNQNQTAGNNFTFNFGGDEKKNRGGFFNMFN